MELSFSCHFVLYFSSNTVQFCYPEHWGRKQTHQHSLYRIIVGVVRLTFKLLCAMMTLTNFS